MLLLLVYALQTTGEIAFNFLLVILMVHCIVMPPKYKSTKQRLNEMSLADLKAIARRRNERMSDPRRRVRVHQTKKQLVRSLGKLGRRKLVVKDGSPDEVKDGSPDEEKEVLQTLIGLSPSKRRVLERYSRTIKKRLNDRERAISHHDRYGEHRGVYNVLRQGSLPGRAADLITTMVRGVQDRDDAVKERRSRKLRASIANLEHGKRVEEKKYAKTMRNTTSVDGMRYHTERWNRTRRKYDQRIKKQESALRSLNPAPGKSIV